MLELGTDILYKGGRVAFIGMYSIDQPRLAGAPTKGHAGSVRFDPRGAKSRFLESCTGHVGGIGAYDWYIPYTRTP